MYHEKWFDTGKVPVKLPTPPLANGNEYQPALWEGRVNKVRKQRFAYYLAQGENPVNAYTLAGYSAEGKVRETCASTLVADKAVQRMFNRALQSREASERITREWIDEKQLRMAGVDARGRLHFAYQMIDPKTNAPKPIGKWPRALRKLVKGVTHTVKTTTTKAGDVFVEERTEFSLHDQYAIFRDLKVPIEKLAFLSAQQNALKNATESAEQAAEKIRDAMLLMAQADGVPVNAGFKSNGNGATAH